MTDRSRGDFETRSAVDLRTAGVHIYAAHESTAPWCLCWAIGDGPIETWTPAAPGPINRLFACIAQGGEFAAWNASFESQIWNLLMVPRFGWPPLPVEQTRCTMVMAYAMALPGSLDAAAHAVGLNMGKDLEGKALMMQLARPRKINADGSYIWWDTPEKLERLYAYCRIDVEVERRIESRLLPLSEPEQELWVLDQKINNRGVHLDMPAILNAMAVVEDAKARLDNRMALTTKGSVRKCSQVQQLKEWIGSRGIDVEGLAKADVIELLSFNLPADVRAAVLLRQEAAKSSTAKLKAMKAGAGTDAQARGLAQFHAATTGRWAGRRIQTQNLPRTWMDQPHIDAVLDMLSEGRL